MLEITLSTNFIPGTNLKGQVAGANWAFLLPNLNLKAILCIGVPDVTSLATLGQLSQSGAVLCPTPEQLALAQKRLQELEISHLRPFLSTKAPAFSAETFDLIFISGRRSASQLADYRKTLVQVQHLLQPKGVIYFEFDVLSTHLWDATTLDDLFGDFAKSTRFWLTPLNGETHTAVLHADTTTTGYFLKHKLTSPTVTMNKIRELLPMPSKSPKKGAASNGKKASNGTAPKSGGVSKKRGLTQRLRPVARQASITVLDSVASAEGFLNSHGLWQRQGLFLGGAEADVGIHPPQYLCDMADAFGVDISNHRWGLSAKGNYSSRKLLFFLFPPHSTEPEYIVKMVRASTFNKRLQNEVDALKTLYEIGIGNRETLPEVIFHGEHNGLTFVAESIVDGVPFRQESWFTADCFYARSAVDWFTQLGALTADTTSATPAEVTDNLNQLLERFIEIYEPAAEIATFLQEQVNKIAALNRPFPLVFQHGDPGTWNAFATPTGKTAMLDWEAAETKGIPLWDIFYFCRSYAVGAGRVQGQDKSIDAFASQFVTRTPIGDFIAEATHNYCAKVGLPIELIEPLFHTCWMHRSLKEATRLKTAVLHTGHYVNLLYLGIEQRDNGTFQRLFNAA